jgi:hypothetical protein
MGPVGTKGDNAMSRVAAQRNPDCGQSFRRKYEDGNYAHALEIRTTSALIWTTASGSTCASGWAMNWAN